MNELIATTPKELAIALKLLYGYYWHLHSWLFVSIKPSTSTPLAKPEV